MVLTYSEQPHLGWQAPDFELKDTEGKIRSLDEFKDKQGLLIVLSCNHCPYAQAAWPILNSLYDKYKDRLHFLAINSNDPIAYPEDSYENMQRWVRERKVKFTYLHDEEQKMARASGPMHARPLSFQTEQRRSGAFLPRADQ